MGKAGDEKEKIGSERARQLEKQKPEASRVMNTRENFQGRFL